MSHIARVLLQNIDILLAKSLDKIIVEIKQNLKIYHHLANVLRVKQGEEVVVFNGHQNASLLCKIAEINKKQIVLIVDSSCINLRSTKTVKRIMVLPLLKKDNLEDSIKTCTEIGVDEFWFVKTQNCHASEKFINFDRVAEISSVAAIQCKINLLPKINQNIFTLQSFIKNAAGTLLLANEHLVGVDKNKPANTDATGNIFMLIGPEGGFAKQEVDFVLANQSSNLLVKNISLGANILRASTAATLMAFVGVGL